MQAVSQAFQICRNNTSQDKLDACLLHVSYGCIFISNSRFVAFAPALVLSLYLCYIFFRQLISPGRFFKVEPILLMWYWFWTIFYRRKKLLLHSSLDMYLSYSTKHQLTSGMPKACKKHPSWPYLYTGYLIYGGNWALMIIVCVFPLLLVCKYTMASKVLSSCNKDIFIQ